jgi:hypothetical protein
VWFKFFHKDAEQALIRAAAEAQATKAGEENAGKLEYEEVGGLWFGQFMCVWRRYPVW